MPDHLSSVMIPVRLAPESPAVHHKRHLDMQLDRPQRIALRRIFDGAVAEEAQLASGRFVKTANDAIKYMLEQVSTAAAQQAATEADPPATATTVPATAPKARQGKKNRPIPANSP